MSNAPRPVRPSVVKVTLSLLFGVVVGLSLVFPAIPETIERLQGGATVGTAGIVIGTSVIALAVVMIGLVTLLRSSY